MHYKQKRDLVLELAAPTDSNRVIISENIFDRDSDLPESIALALIGGADAERAGVFTVTDNLFNNAAVYMEQCSNVIFNNNIVLSAANDYSVAPFTSFNLMERFVFENNVVVNNGPDGHAVLFSNGESANLQDLIFSGNTVELGDCYFENCHNVSFTDNQVRQQGESTKGLFYELTTNPSDFALRDFATLQLYNSPTLRCYGISFMSGCKKMYTSVTLTPGW
jgi:hypothetical protein